MIDIRDLPLSDEIIYILKFRGKILVLPQLLEATEAELLSIHGIGKQQLKYIKKAIYWYRKSNEIKLEKDDLLAVLRNTIINEIKDLVQFPMNNINHEINEFRTILCEQYRLIQNIEIEKSPEGIIRRINEKIPGFSSTIFDIYKKLNES
jgi:DNA repair protein RadC